MPVLRNYKEGKFFLKRDQRYFATPLFIVLLVVETTDVMFALDSIPAVIAITTDPFIVYTSNVFAILGLRAIFFALSGIMQLFHYLHYGLSFILVFVGVKMLISKFYEVPVEIALGVIVGVLTISVIASMIKPRKTEEISPIPNNPSVEE
jgi:tellurite resistance protein TerC